MVQSERCNFDAVEDALTSAGEGWRHLQHPVDDYKKLDLLKTVARAKPATARLTCEGESQG